MMTNELDALGKLYVKALHECSHTEEAALTLSVYSVLSLTTDVPATEKAQVSVSVQHECKVMKSTIWDTDLLFLDE